MPATCATNEAIIAGVLRRIDAAAAALPSRPEAALRELLHARALLVTSDNGNGSTSRPAALHAGLTTREHEVLLLLARGDRNKEIARVLGLRERTIKFHVANLLRKLDAQSRTEALRRALELGLLNEGERAAGSGL